MSTGTRSARVRRPGPAVPRAATVRAVAVALAVAAGAVLSLQAWVNGRLGGRVHDGVAAAALSDGAGLLVLLLVCPWLPAFRAGVRRLAAALRTPPGAPGRLRPHHFLGGLVGGVVVLSQGVSTGALGTAAYTVALVGGQTLSGLWVDHFGLGPGDACRVTPRRIAGAALALAAVAVPLLGSLATGAVWLAALPLLAGIGLSWQMAVNGRLNVEARTPYPSVTLNFLLAAVVLGAALCVDIARAGLPRHWPGDPLLYSGGLLGLVFVLASVLLVRRIGVLVTGLAMVAGQTVGALLVDALFPGDAGTGPGAVLSSLAVLLAAVLACQSPNATARTARDERPSLEPELTAP
ncbi:DMT family transporter [Streptomyces sp. NPDC000151]|uniref:DMT family transporter n=1 Tax=Streptomyces sp. NPDC000151 TaxID=3154244 RepID=UPI00331BF9EA